MDGYRYLGDGRDGRNGGKGGVWLGRWLFEVEDVGDGALAVVVECGVVGWVADGAVCGCPEGCASSSVEVDGVGASELAHEIGELGDGHSMGVAGVSAVDGEDDDVAVGGEAYCGAGMRVGGEG